jgi:hypothetical protein
MKKYGKAIPRGEGVNQDVWSLLRYNDIPRYLQQWGIDHDLEPGVEVLLMNFDNNNDVFTTHEP